MGFTFTFYGMTYNSIFLNTNGGFTFGGGNSNHNQAAASISHPGIGVFWGDMHAELWGANTRPNQMTYEQFPNRFVIKYNQFQDHDEASWNNTATVTLFPNGAIVIEYEGVSSPDILMGVFDGTHADDQKLTLQPSFPDYEAVRTGIILFDAWGPGPTHNGQLSNQRIVFGNPPVTTVTKVDSVADTGDGQLMDGEAVTVDITQLLVTFSGPVMDLAGNSDPDDVTNPENYRLFNAGTNETFQTSVCGPPQGDDASLAINSVAYNDATNTAAINVNGGVPLPLDIYRLMVCGSTSIKDENGIALDGDNDTIEGGDFLLNFIVGAGVTLQVVPNTLSVAAGSKDNAAISGGQSPYTASSSDNATATASVSGNTLNVTGVAPGTATISVMDDLGASVGVDVTVTAGAPLSVSPSSVKVAVEKTDNVTISGGQSPYTASSSDPDVATTSVSDNTVSITGVSPGSATVTVSDNGTNSAPISVTVSSDNATVGGCAAGPNVTQTIDTSIFDEVILLLCQQLPVAANGRLYIGLAAENVFPDLLFFRPEAAPLPNGSYVQLVKDSSGFLPGAKDAYFFEGILNQTSGDVSFTVATEGLEGLSLTFRTFFLPTRLEISDVNLQLIQVVTITFN
jgi:hypothetical protein